MPTRAPSTCISNLPSFSLSWISLETNSSDQALRVTEQCYYLRYIYKWELKEKYEMIHIKLSYGRGNHISLHGMILATSSLQINQLKGLLIMIS
jgi:hypothetical protein